MRAVERELERREHEPLHAPELVEPETLSALRGLARERRVSEQRAGQAAQDLERVRLMRYPHAPLGERVWQLRNQLSAYDATYLALAEALDSPLLMTADRGLATVAQRSLGPEGVRIVK